MDEYNSCVVSDEEEEKVEEVIVDGEQNDRTDGSIRVNPKTCIIHFQTGHTYTYKIQLLNTTVLPQIIWIQPPDNKIFKFPNLTTVTIPPGGSWNLQFTFMSNSNEEFKSYLHLKNQTGQENLDVELKAVPSTHSGLPKTINFGNVDIGMSVTRKLRLAPELNPYRFRIFIPRESQDLHVDPTIGEVSCDSSTDVTVRYTPSSLITLCIDLVFYHSGDNKKPQVITIMAVTKPKNNTTENIKTEKSVPPKIDLSPSHGAHRRSTHPKNDKRPLNKMSVNKPCKIPMESNSWNSALGEPDEVYREAYAQDCKEFLLTAKMFGKEHRNTSMHVKSEPKTMVVDENLKRYIIEKRDIDWEAYKEKLCSYQNLSHDAGSQESTKGLRERSIRMNHIVTTDHEFDPNLDDNWSEQFRTSNKFISVARKIILINRLEKRLNIFKLLIRNNIIN